VAPNWQEEQWDPAKAYKALRATPLHVAHRTIGPFLEAYEIVAIRLADRLPSRPIDKKDFIAECIGFAKMRWLQRSLHSPESISKNLFDGALQLAGNRRLVDPGGEELRERRQAFADQLTEAVALVQEVRAIANAQEGLTQGDAP
jgi:glycerol-3-phosphate O-acyltransferase